MEDAGGLMKIRAPPPPIRSEFIMLSGYVPPGATVELLPSTFFKFAVIVSYGNGEPQTRVDIEVGPYPGTIEYVNSFFPDQAATRIYANKAVRIIARNTDLYSPRSYTRVDIIYLDW
jgi:hypothetical protein